MTNLELYIEKIKRLTSPSYEKKKLEEEIQKQNKIKEDKEKYEKMMFIPNRIKNIKNRSLEKLSGYFYKNCSEHGAYNLRGIIRNNILIEIRKDFYFSGAFGIFLVTEPKYNIIWENTESVETKERPILPTPVGGKMRLIYNQSIGQNGPWDIEINKILDDIEKEIKENIEKEELEKNKDKMIFESNWEKYISETYK